jgi:hypothetical protein
MSRSIVALIVLAVGCAPIENTPRKEKPAPPAATSELTQAAMKSFCTRDRDFADQLDALAAEVDGGKIKYDAKLAQRLDECRKHAVDASNSMLSAAIAKEFGSKAMETPERVSKALRDVAKALRR